MILPENIKSRCRVHMGVPVLGIQNSGFALGYRFTNVMGLFEWRMNNLQPYELASITGNPTASNTVYAAGNGPHVGDTLVITINTSAVTYTVQSSDFQGTNPDGVVDPMYTIVNNAAAAVTQQLSSLVVALPQPAVTYPSTFAGAGPMQWQMAYSSTNGQPFTLAVASTGNLLAYPLTQGVSPSPTITFLDDSVTATGYVPICDYLEQNTAQASSLVKFTKADVVNFRQDELAARDQIYEYWRQRLADVFGIPLYSVPPVANFGGVSTGMEQ